MTEQALILPVRLVYNATTGETAREYPEDLTDPALTKYPCRIQSAAKPEEGLSAEQERAVAWWELQLPVRARTDHLDRIYQTGRDAGGGKYSRMLEVFTPDGPRTWQAVLKVLCWELVPTTAQVTEA